MVRRSADDEIVYLLDRTDLVNGPDAAGVAARIRELLHDPHVTPSVAGRATQALELWEFARFNHRHRR